MSEEKTVTGLLSEIADKVCEYICKYPEIAKAEVKDPDLADDYLYEKYCANCPLNMI